MQKCADRTVSDKSKFPTFIRTYPTETQVILHFFVLSSFLQFKIKETNALNAADKREILDDSIKCSAFSCFTFECSGAETHELSCLFLHMKLCICKCEIRHGYRCDRGIYSFTVSRNDEGGWGGGRLLIIMAVAVGETV